MANKTDLISSNLDIRRDPGSDLANKGGTILDHRFGRDKRNSKKRNKKGSFLKSQTIQNIISNKRRDISNKELTLILIRHQTRELREML